MKGFCQFILPIFLFTRLFSQPCSINCNGSFDTPTITTTNALVTAISCWSTTATDGKMEVWGNGYAGVSSYGGPQFVELNATQAATMYEEFNVTNGVQVDVSFAHRGRSGTDTVQVSIGPVGGPYTILGNWGDGTSAWGYYSVPYTPTSTAAYQVNFTPIYWSGGNVAIGNFLDSVSVTQPIGSLTLAVSAPTLCSGNSAVLNAAGATTYTWSTSANSSSIIVTPSVTTTYTLSATSAVCISTVAITVTASPIPTVSISGVNPLCLGNSSTLTASGAQSYSWNTSAISPTIVVSPITNTVYSVIGSANTCTGTSAISLTVNPVPLVSISGTNPICFGNSSTLTASGAQTYSWSTTSTASQVAVSPSVTTSYTVYGVSNGCKNSSIITITVNPTPTVSISGTNPICFGNSTTLTAFGAQSYTWNTSSTASAIVISPTVNPSYYSVVGFLGICSATALITVTVNPLPSVSVSGINVLCLNRSTTLTASGAQSYTWTPGNLTTPVVNLTPTATTVYSVTGTSTNNCSNTTAFSVTVNPIPNISIPQPTYSACPGSVTIFTATGGASYTWSPSGSNGSTYSVAPVVNTSYSVLGASAAGCTATATGTVLIKPIPVLAIVPFSITCASLGSATVTPSGGVGPFSFTWIPTGQTSSVATGLSPLTYTIEVFDTGTGCTSFSTTTFTSLIPLTGNLNNTSSLTCNSVNTATAFFSNLAGGSPNQNYFWTDGTMSYSTPTVNTLGAGSWTATVTDALTSCQIFSVFTITQPPAITVSIVADTPTACVATNIILTGVTSGGTSGYTYTWTAGPSATSNTVSQNTGGAYVYTLNSTDANSCFSQHTISVNFIDTPVLSINNVLICPFAIGTLTVGGATTYTWNNPITVGNTFTDNPLSDTQYSVIGSALGCTSIATASLNLKPVPIPTLSSNSPLCNGSELVLSASGGVFYTWTGPPAFTASIQNPTINPVGVFNAGVYNVTVTAANSCTAPASTNVVVYPTPTLAASGSTVCTIQTMSLSASSSAGVVYTWLGPLGFTSSSPSITISNPSVNQSGAYTVVVTSVQGCTNEAIALVSVVTPPNLLITPSSNTICAQALSGSPNTLSLNLSGATTYTLLVPNGINNSNPGGPISPLYMMPPYQPTGPYTATLQGSNGVCSVSVTSNFTVVPNPTITINLPAPVICVGQSYTYTGSGATTYSWSAASPSNYIIANGNWAVVSPTSNALFSVIGGSLGCNSASESSNLTVNLLPQVAINPDPAKVCLGQSVMLTVKGTGSSYAWSPSAWLSTTTGTAVSANPPLVQNYSYMVVASLNNCTTSAVVSVSVLPLPVAVIVASTQALCMNNTINLQGSGGSSYLWNGPSNYSSNEQIISFNAISTSYSGIYTLTVSDQNNCQGSATQSITVYGLPSGYFDPGQLKGCVPFCTDLTFQTAVASAPISQMNWQVNGANFVGSTFHYCFNKTGNYKITGTLSDANNCVNTLTTLVNVYPKPEAGFSFNPDLPVANLNEVLFSNTSTGDQITNWSWYFINNGGYQSQKANVSYLFPDPGIYPIAMIVTNVWGCSDSIVKTITVDPDFNIYVPNAFTPNADGLNELFFPVMTGVAKYDISIFDRWGALIFKTADPQNKWDGNYKGAVCKEDVYIWKIQVSFLNGKKKDLIGHVTLYR